MATSTRGLGQSAFGGADWGYGTAAPAVEPAPSAQTFARSIDPQTGDYSATSDGFATVAPKTQQVVLALTTELGSIPHRPDFGIRLPRKITNGFASEVDTAVRAAVRHIAGLEILAITTTFDPVIAGRFETRVRFRDTVTGAEDTTAVGASA